MKKQIIHLIINLSPKEKLNGTWEIVKATGLYEKMNLGTLYIFEGTKRFSTKKGIIVNEGDIQHITDSTYSVIFDGMTTEYFFSYTFQENNLIIEAGTESQVFTLEKKNK